LKAKKVMSNNAFVSHRKVARSSNRSFGFVFAGVFTVIGLLPLLSGGQARLWSLAVGGSFVVIAYFVPRMLGPLNLVWYKVGLVLHHVVNPVVMLMLYCVAIVPIGLMMRARGNDLLRLAPDKPAPTYWISREPLAPSPGSMSKQF
jgi:hypothetical protein